MATISEESSELEAMRREDGSWHPCHVSLSSNSSSGYAIIIDFRSGSEEDIISDKEDALARLRYRSAPLQGGDCSDIKEGKHILGMHKTNFRSLFFDAVVEKVWRIKHSNRIHCRCTFEIKWLCSELKEENMTLSSSSIMKLSGKNVHSHPVVAQFFGSLSPASSLEVPLYLCPLDGINCEANLLGLVEKQIEEISNLADASKKKFSDNILSEIKRVDHTASTWNKIVVDSQIGSLCNQDDFRRSPKHRNHRELEMEVDKQLEGRPCLTPLGARAALASLVHKLPQKTEFPNWLMDKESYVNPPVKHTEESINILSVDACHMFRKSDLSIQENISSYPIQNPNNYSSEEDRHELKPSTSKQRITSRKSQTKKVSPAVIMKYKPTQVVNDSEDRRLGSLTIMTPLTNSVTEGDLNEHSSLTRLTRSMVRKGKRDLIGETVQELSNMNEKFESPTTSTPLTHSFEQKQTGNSTSAAKQEPRNGNFSQDPQFGVSTEDCVTPEKNAGKKKKSVTSSVDETSLPPQMKRRSNSLFAVPTIKEKQGEVSGGCKYPPTKKQKFVSSKKPDLRFSPRLRYLPRTRSQKKS